MQNIIKTLHRITTITLIALLTIILIIFYFNINIANKITVIKTKNNQYFQYFAEFIFNDDPKKIYLVCIPIITSLTILLVIQIIAKKNNFNKNFTDVIYFINWILVYITGLFFQIPNVILIIIKFFNFSKDDPLIQYSWLKPYKTDILGEIFNYKIIFKTSDTWRQLRIRNYIENKYNRELDYKIVLDKMNQNIQKLTEAYDTGINDGDKYLLNFILELNKTPVTNTTTNYWLYIIPIAIIAGLALYLAGNLYLPVSQTITNQTNLTNNIARINQHIINGNQTMENLLNTVDILTQQNLENIQAQAITNQNGLAEIARLTAELTTQQNNLNLWRQEYILNMQNLATLLNSI